jgi:hypothetical protein
MRSLRRPRVASGIAISVSDLDGLMRSRRVRGGSWDGLTDDIMRKGVRKAACANCWQVFAKHRISYHDQVCVLLHSTQNTTLMSMALLGGG